MSEVATDPQPVACAGIQFDAKSLREVDSGRVMVLLSRADIRRVTLRHGSPAQHPVVQVIAGFIMLAMGALPTLYFLHWMREGGRFILHIATMFLFPVLGVWFIYGGFIRRHYLDVETSTGNKKLQFSGKPQLVEIRSFLKTAENSFGYKVEEAACVRDV
ncbi:MAG TPA: hypothetical protein VG269_18530 [Tepidisphaeraceae bacterium]|jgi:hypothetical protein|nr:hypothetical protein [Tepidisphaeraceae bacterium]